MVIFTVVVVVGIVGIVEVVVTGGSVVVVVDGGAVVVVVVGDGLGVVVTGGAVVVVTTCVGGGGAGATVVGPTVGCRTGHAWRVAVRDIAGRPVDGPQANQTTTCLGMTMGLNPYRGPA